LAGFYALIEMAKVSFWVFPFVVIGMNSIAAYCMDWLFANFFRGALRTHLGEGWNLVFGPEYARLIEGGVILTVLWLILYWMYRRKLFLKI
jgi:predicted acyltransferase